MEIGAYSFGDTQFDDSNNQTDTAGAIPFPRAPAPLPAS